MVRFVREGDTLVCEFSGRLDSTLCMQLDASIAAEAQATAGAVVFDLKDVEYIASMFIRTCVSMAKLVGKERFRVQRATPMVKKVFKMAGLDAALNVE